MIVGLPLLLAAAGAAAVLPIVVHLLVRRRTVEVHWGAMRFLESALRRQGRHQLLRQLLFLVRILMLPTAGAALAAIMFTTVTGTPKQWNTVLLDDTIGAWAADETGSRSIDHQFERLAALRAQGSVQVITLSGRPTPPDVTTLASIDAGPDWQHVMRTIKLLRGETNDGVLMLAPLRGGTMPTQGDLYQMQNEGIELTIYPHPVDQTNVVRITSIHTPRTHMLPDDPLSHGQIDVHLQRDNGKRAATNELSMFGDDDVLVSTATVRWRQGETQQVVQAGLPQGTTDYTVWRVQLDAGDTPASVRWFTLPHIDAGRVHLLSNGVPHSFDASRQESWLDVAIRAGADDESLQARHVRADDLLVDTLHPREPLIVVGPDLLDTATWRALLSRIDEGRVLVFPRDEGTPQAMNSLITSISDTPTDLLRTPNVTDVSMDVQVRAHTGPLSMVAGELDTLLGAAHVERMLDLRELSKVARPLVSLGQWPLFMQFHDAPVVVSAVAWTPTWSDLPLHSVGPTLVQELLRGRMSDAPPKREHIAHAPARPNAGPQQNGDVVQPDASAVSHSGLTPADHTSLVAADWRVLDQAQDASAARSATPFFLLLLAGLIVLETLIARVLDASGRATVPRDGA